MNGTTARKELRLFVGRTAGVSYAIIGSPDGLLYLKAGPVSDADARELAAAAAWIAGASEAVERAIRGGKGHQDRGGETVTITDLGGRRYAVLARSVLNLGVLVEEGADLDRVLPRATSFARVLDHFPSEPWNAG